MCIIKEEIRQWEQNEALKILTECGLLPGMNVLDFGCGAPHYAIPAAMITGNTGTVYAVDQSEPVLEHIRQRIREEKIGNMKPVQYNEAGIRNFTDPVQFVLYYDLFHSVGRAAKGIKNRIAENKALFREFHRLLSKGGIFSFAVYNEITLVQDPVNGPFSPKGRPKWFHVPYEEAFQEWYQLVPLIESCGYKLRNFVKNGGVHFDEIDFRFHVKKNQKMHLSALERRDIYNFVKI